MSELRNPAEIPDKVLSSDSHDVPNRRDFLTGLLAGAGALLSGCLQTTKPRIRAPFVGCEDAIMPMLYGEFRYRTGITLYRGYKENPNLYSFYKIQINKLSNELWRYPVDLRKLISSIELSDSQRTYQVKPRENMQRYPVVLSLYNINQIHYAVNQIKHQAEESEKSDIEIIERRYGCKISKEDIMDDKELSAKAIGEIRYELAKYPPDLIYKSKIKKIKITKADIVGYSYGGWISIDADKVSSQLHHEIAHEVYKSRRHAEWYLFLKHWVSLNEKGWHSYSKNFNCGQSPRPAGFISWYAKCHFLEDLAEISEGLFASIFQTEQICKEDPVVTKKVRMWKDELYRLTNGRIGPQYWEDLKAGKVNEEYWDKH